MDYTISVDRGRRIGAGGPGRARMDRMTDSWMIDELAHAGAEHLDPEFVAGYDRKAGYPDPDEDLAIFEAHGLDGTSTVVDIGAGSGQFYAAPR
jgi:hypothetical protein